MPCLAVEYLSVIEAGDLINMGLYRQSSGLSQKDRFEKPELRRWTISKRGPETADKGLGRPIMAMDLAKWHFWAGP
jgi:hypothetical protein